MNPLSGQVALVTGASRGVGRGVAAQLADEGAIVYATGRSILDGALPEGIHSLRCDHTVDDEVTKLFEEIRRTEGRLDILVNSAWGGYERMVESGQFTWSAQFWEQPLWRWDAMMIAGVRSAFVASQHAARIMLPAGKGLIVNLSFWAARKHVANVIYGVSKAATDKMTADMAFELRKHGVVVVSLYPGLVRTEAVMAAGVLDLSNSESPEFIGKVIGALARDPNGIKRSGQVVVAAQFAAEVGLTDIEGRCPRPLTLDEV